MSDGDSKSLMINRDHPLYDEANRLMEDLGARIGALTIAVRGAQGNLEGWEPEGLAFIAGQVDEQYWSLADFIYGPTGATRQHRAG